MHGCWQARRLFFQEPIKNRDHISKRRHAPILALAGLQLDCDGGSRPVPPPQPVPPVRGRAAETALQQVDQMAGQFIGRMEGRIKV